MYASWARVTRSAAARAFKARSVIQSTRQFHISATVRAAANAAEPNESPDDADSPKDNTSGETGQENVKDDNLFGDKGLSSNGDARGRQRRANASSRRALRHKTPEELPPVQLPSTFSEDRIFRYGDVRGDVLSTDSAERDAPGAPDVASALGQFGDPKQNPKQLDPDQVDIADQPWKDIFEATSLRQLEVQNFKETMGMECIEDMSLRSAVSLIVAWNSVLSSAATLLAGSSEEPERYSKLLQEGRDIRISQLREDNMKVLEMATYFVESIQPYDLSPESRLSTLRNILHSKIRFHSDLGTVHHDALVEASSSIRADFSIQPPQSIKMTELKRPITVVNFPYYAGFEWPKYVMQDVATDLCADMIHITAQDIAEIAGPYLGQDMTRAPGSLSLLGYKAADNAGMVYKAISEQVEEEIQAQLPFSIVIPTGNPKKEGKKKLSIMDFIGEPSRGKSDEMWVDLKINAVLEELVHVADSDGSEQRPLIIHVHDINALNMDEDCGALILGKLRKIVDDLWVEGRKIALVGTCSSKGSPLAYRTALKEMRKNERVVDLQPSSFDDTKLELHMDATALGHGQNDTKPFLKKLKEVSRNEYLDENTRNIATMLRTLLHSDSGHKYLQVGFSLRAMEERHRPEKLLAKLLSVSDVYRLAKTMIGLRKQRPEVFDQTVLEEAVRLIKHIDHESDRKTSSMDRLGSEIRRNLTGESDGLLGPSSEYEKRFRSALVNPKDLKTTFKDIHAPVETIESIKMLTQLSLLRPEAFSYGVLATERIPGCLLYGPPGTGKTLLAKAVAKESGANMIEVSGASINQMYVGESEKNIRALFSLAKKKEPLVIFIDEADALLGARGGRNDAAGRRDVINQFLREWDGMETSKAFIMVATNRPFDLDEAVLRRLPRKLLVDLPLEADRAAILKIHLKDEALDDTVSIEQMAKQTALYSGSDLKNVCVAAAMAAVKEELEASEKHTGPEPYVWLEKRILNSKHFEKALAEIPASVSEDMATLNAIKKFDERYGEKKTRRKRRGMGFEVIPDATDSHEARVRNVQK